MKATFECNGIDGFVLYDEKKKKAEVSHPDAECVADIESFLNHNMMFKRVVQKGIDGYIEEPGSPLADKEHFQMAMCSLRGHTDANFTGFDE